MHRVASLREIVPQPAHLVQLVAESVNRSFLLEHLDVLEDGCHNLRVVFEAFLGEFDRDLELGQAEADRVLAHLQVRRQILAFQEAQDRVATLVAKELHEVFEVDLVDLVREVRHVPYYFELIYVLNWHHFDQMAGVTLSVRWRLAKVGNVHFLVLERLELRRHHLLQFLQFPVARHAKRHHIRRVVLLKELNHCLAGLRLCQLLLVAKGELVNRTLGMSQLQVQVCMMPKVAEKRCLHLVMDILDHFNRLRIRESRVYEHAGKAVETIFEGFVLHFEMVVGTCPVRVRVDFAVVLLEEVFILLHFRVLLRGLRKHVLEIHGRATEALWVHEGADLHLHAGGAHGGIRIRYQEASQSIWKCDVLRRPLVFLSGHDGILVDLGGRYRFLWRCSTCSWRFRRSRGLLLLDFGVRLLDFGLNLLQLDLLLLLLLVNLEGDFLRRSTW